MIPVKILTHLTDGLARLMQQYKGQPNITGILKVYLRRWQAMEDLIYQLLSTFDIASATGNQLDVIGGMVGEIRQTSDDEIYRALIYLRIFRQRMTGTVPNVIKLYKSITKAERVEYTPSYPAGFSVNAINPTGTLSGTLIRSIMLTMVGAGIEAELLQSTADPAFVFEGGDGEGFGDVNDPATGGGLAGENK